MIQRDRKGEDGKLTDKFMNEVLFYAVKEEEPWEGLNCFIYDYRPVFYSNALACALLTLKYLSADVERLQTTVDSYDIEQIETSLTAAKGIQNFFEHIPL